MERAHTTDYLTAAQPENSRLVKIVFLAEAETTSKSGGKSRFSVMDVSTSDAIWGLWFTLSQGLEFQHMPFGWTQFSPQHELRGKHPAPLPSSLSG